jgi:tripartite-type tricarboxylate transporter receptor subunit TctC
MGRGLRKGVARLVLIGSTVITLACSGHRPFPDGPILLVCPWAAGGGSDRIARQVAALLEQQLGIPISVVNVTGGDGVTGHSRGALARADGHTLTLVTVEIASLHWRGMTSISPGDFAPVGLVNRDAAAVFVRADAPWQTLRDLEQTIRKSPRTLRASGTATAGIWHLGIAGWLSTVGLQPSDIIWVSIAGSAPSFQELLAGGVDVVSCSLAEAQALMAAGRVRSLGVMAEARVPQFPNVPTFKELGVDWSLGTIRGIAVPKGTPEHRVAMLAAALKRVVEGNEFRTAMLRSGFTPSYEDPAQFAVNLAETDKRLGTLLASEAFKGLETARFGPMFFPGLLIGALALVTTALVVGARTPITPHATPGTFATWRFVEVLIWIALYLLLAETLGFVITATALLLAYLVSLGTRPAIATPLALLIVPLVYQVFAVALRVPLPRGLFGW